ncbi:ribonuclease H-like domain-containing protein [Tanacetum coccineum]
MAAGTGFRKSVSEYLMKQPVFNARPSDHGKHLVIEAYAFSKHALHKLEFKSKLGPEGVHVQDPTLYRSLARGLQYLTFTRPDLSRAVQQVCLYMHDPREPHFAALKRILRYVRGTVDFSLQLYASATTSLVGYTDADWAGCSEGASLCCSQAYLALCSRECGLWEPHFAALKRILRYVRGNVDFGLQLYASATTSLLNVSTPFLAPVPKLNTAWLHNLLRELHSHLSTATLVYCDNVSVVYMPGNPVQHQWTKHIEIDIQFVRDIVTASQVRVLHVPSRYQYVDIFTKGLSSALFEEFRSSLSVHPPPAPTAGAY